MHLVSPKSSSLFCHLCQCRYGVQNSEIKLEASCDIVEGLSPEIKTRAKSSGPSLPVVRLHVVLRASTSKSCLHFHMSCDCLGRQQNKLVSAWALSRRACPGQFSLVVVQESSPEEQVV